MMYYLMITISALIFSIQFLFSDRYQKEAGSGWNSSLKLSLYSSVTGLIALLIINKFRLEISLFSIVVAVFYSVIIIGLNYSSVKAFKYANLSVYSVFSMIGGMLLPFVYGVICGEEFKITRIICCFLILLSVLMNIDKSKSSKKAFKYYMAVFILNGMVGVVSKFHQSKTDLCVDSASFLIYSKIIITVMSAILIAAGKQRSFKINRKAFIYSSGGAVLNSIANLMLLIALLHLPASVQYPIVTGGVIVFSFLIDLIRKADISKKEIASAAVAFISTVVMSI